MHDTFWCGRFRALNVFDEGMREVLAIEVDTSLPERVIRLLEQLKDSHLLPKQIRVDNGPELVSAHEVLDAHVREHVHQWLVCYNEERRHESLGNIPPALFRETTNQPQNRRYNSGRGISEMLQPTNSHVNPFFSGRMDF